MESPSQKSVNVIVSAYLKRNDYNILVLDWSSLADGNFFFDAVPNAKLVFNHSNHNHPVFLLLFFAIFKPKIYFNSKQND